MKQVVSSQSKSAEGHKFIREVWWYTLILTGYTIFFVAWRQWLLQVRELANFGLTFWLTIIGILVVGIIISKLATILAKKWSANLALMVRFEIGYILAVVVYVILLWVFLY